MKQKMKNERELLTANKRNQWNPMNTYIQVKTHLKDKIKVKIDLRISSLVEYGLQCITG